MDVALKKVGNSMAVVIPTSILKDLSIRAGQHLSLQAMPDGKIVLTPMRKYVLANMIAQCDPKAPPPADLALWEATLPAPGESL